MRPNHLAVCERLLCSSWLLSVHALSHAACWQMQGLVSDPAPVTWIRMEIHAHHTSECGLFGVLGSESRGLAGILLVRLTECLLLFRQLISLQRPDNVYYIIFSDAEGYSILALGLSRCIATGNSREACKSAEVQQTADGTLRPSRHPCKQLM